MADDPCIIRGFLNRSEYKTVCSHNNIIRGCKCHPNDNGHKMKVSYLRCVSALCIRDPDETCPFKYQIRECEENQTSYLYRV